MSNRSWHELIHNPADIEQFAGLFEVKSKSFALCHYLTMRRKYFPALSHGTTIINRSAVPGGTHFAKRFHQSILKLETSVGTYTDNELVVPTEAMAIYVIINPCNTIKALSKTLTRCMDAILAGEEINGYSIYREELPKATKSLQVDRSKSDLPKTIASSKEHYRQIDLDTKEVAQVQLAADLLTETGVQVVVCIETRGGFHIIITAGEDRSVYKRLYEFKSKTAFKKPNVNGETVTDHWFSITNQPVVILPGTYQGGFPARIISLTDWLHATQL